MLVWNSNLIILSTPITLMALQKNLKKSTIKYKWGAIEYNPVQQNSTNSEQLAYIQSGRHALWIGEVFYPFWLSLLWKLSYYKIHILWFLVKILQTSFCYLIREFISVFSLFHCIFSNYPACSSKVGLYSLCCRMLNFYEINPWSQSYLCILLTWDPHSPKMRI